MINKNKNNNLKKNYKKMGEIPLLIGKTNLKNLMKSLNKWNKIF